VLTTERLCLREFVADDAPWLQALLEDAEVMEFVGGPTRDPESAAKRIARCREMYRARSYGLWAVVERASGVPIGRCGLIDQVVDDQNETEIAFLFARGVWGKGFATEAACAVRDHALRGLGLARLICLFDPRNTAAQRLGEKLGMVFEKQTVWREREVLVFGIRG
jgi:RimJ/RimL family protein N-acetyltransferase